MAKVIFKSQSINTPELFPINIFDKIPENHPVRLVDQVVNSLDINTILKKYKGGGTSAYHPRMMLKVLFYSYLSNTYSCRKIAKALTENIHFMFMVVNEIVYIMNVVVKIITKTFSQLSLCMINILVVYKIIDKQKKI